MQNKNSVSGSSFFSTLAILLLSFFVVGSACAQEPIVFVHGYANGPSNWDTMVSRFTASGYPASKLYRFSYNSLLQTNETSASQLSDFVNAVRAQNGNAQVAIIGHSNGGLVARWYRAKLGGAASIRRFITLGTPHYGSTTAYGCISPVCYEMRPYSLFLTSLYYAGGCDRSLWSVLDGLVLPYYNAQCGTSVQTASVPHMSLLTDASVYNLVRQQLQ